MSYGVNLGWGGPTGEYIGFRGGLIQGIYYKFSPGLICMSPGCLSGIVKREGLPPNLPLFPFNCPCAFPFDSPMVASIFFSSLALHPDPLNPTS